MANTGNTGTFYTHLRLTAGSTRHYRVSAINSQGTGSPSNVASATTSGGAGRPGAPLGLSATAASRTQINLSWTAPASSGGSAITGYKIEVSSDAGTNWRDLVANTGSTITTYTHAGLTAGTTRHYRVSAINSAGAGSPSNIASATTSSAGAPGAPTGLTATAASQTQINLTWTAPGTTGASAITGYKIEVSSNGGTNWSNLVANTGTTGTVYTHAGLTPGTTRHYRVSAINSQGTGPPSNVANATTTGGTVGRPGAPTGLSATHAGQKLINLSWTTPANAGSSAITGYKIEVSSDAGTNWRDLVANTGSTITTYTHTGLSPGTTRHYRVSAINSQGTGPSSNVASATTRPGVPDAPLGLTATGGVTAIELHWDPPERDGGSDILGYRIEVSLNNLSWSVLAAPSSQATSYTHRGLSPGSRRYYRVRARNALGSGPYSPVAHATTIALPSAPRDLQADVAGRNVTLRWREPVNDGGGEVTGYRIERSSDGRRWSLVTATATDLTWTVTGLEAAETLSFRVAAINEAGAGAWSEVVTVTTEAAVPDPPPSLIATHVSTTSIRLAWSAPQFTGGRGIPIIGYKIERHSGGDWAVLIPNTQSLATSHIDKGLSPGTEYFYRVSAINKVGTGRPSMIFSARTSATIPGPPRGLTVTAAGSDRLRLDWDAPAYDGGGEVTGYKVEARRDGAWMILVPNTRSTQTTYVHTGLRPAETWTYRVTAINEAGLGRVSETASGTTDPVVADPPRSLKAEADGPDRISLSWIGPDYGGGSPVTGYLIESSQDQGVTWTVLARTQTTATTFVHTGLEPATTWHYRVSAVNSVGRSDPSPVAFATTEAVVPGKPEAVVATARDHETVQLSWQEPSFIGGAGIIGYRVDVTRDEGDNWETLTFNTGDDATRYVHDGLAPATVYSYRVYAINRIGTGPPSEPASVRTLARVPDPPRNLTAVAVAPDQIDIDWDAPEYDGGAPVTAYRVEFTTDGDDLTWEVLATTERTRYSHQEIVPGTTVHYRVSAINEAGTSQPSETVSATTDDTADRIERLNRAILPKFAATVASGITGAIADRMDAIANGRATHAQIGSLQSVPTGGLGALANGASASRALSSRISAWGSVDRTNMSKIKGEDNVHWEGVVTQLFTGSDVEVLNGLHLGLAASHAAGSYDATDFSWNYEVEGRYKASVTNFSPYLGWNPSEYVTVWASGSYGFGKIAVEDRAADFRASDAKMKTGAGGLVSRLRGNAFGSVSLRVEGWLSTMDVDAAQDFKPVSLDLGRVRMALEWIRVKQSNGGHEFSMSMTGGLRHDFNEDALNHSGFEFGGGAAYVSPSRRIRLTTTGRMLVTTDIDYDEWGIGGAIHLEPQSGGGLAVVAEPSYGPYTSGVEQLWHNGVASLAATDRAFMSPVSIEYRMDHVKPYLRLYGERTFIGAAYKGLSVEVLSAGGQPGIAIKGVVPQHN